MSQRQVLPHVQTAPVDVSAMVEENAAAHTEPWQYTWPDGTTRRRLSVEPELGGETFLLYLPGGYGRAEEVLHAHANPNGRFETHTCHEEIFNLGGSYSFAHWYDFPTMGYLNHPPLWVHPADQATPTGALLLIKNSCPVDFEFTAIPDGWDGVEGVADGQGGFTDNGGVTMLSVHDVPWEPLLDAAGAPVAGAQAKHLWKDAATGWSTWMMQVPAGWQEGGEPAQLPGGDEMFLLEGDYQHPVHGDLAAQTYYCDAQTFTCGGASSRAGAVAIRWTLADDVLTLPARPGA